MPGRSDRNAGPAAVGLMSPMGAKEHGPGQTVILNPHWDHMIAVGGGGSWGSPALVSGKKISRAASITSTTAARR